MKWFLLLFLGTTGVVIVATCVLVLFLRHRLRRHHRVDPKVATSAPLTWVADPRQAARLHRRLAKVGRAAGAVADDHRVGRSRGRRVDQPPLVGIADDLRSQAVALDHEVAHIALLTASARKRSLGELDRAVAELERACVQLVALSAEVRTPPVLASEHDDITNIAAQVERLAEAHRALLELDADAGLVPRPQPATPPPPTAQRRPA